MATVDLVVDANGQAKVIGVGSEVTTAPEAERASTAAEASPVGPLSHVQILKSTAIIGGASVVNVLFAIVRNKAMAVLLGPQGVGLMGLYSSIADLTQTFAGLGIQDSGVRQIAEAVGTGDADRIARTATVLKRVSVVLGILGALLLAAFSFQVADFTFGDSQHAVGVALLAGAVFFRLISAGQIALVQGMRRISDLARINMLGALFSTAISIPMVFFLGTDGIVLSLVAMAAVSILTSWWYSRKIQVSASPVSFKQVQQEAGALLTLGIVFMATNLLNLAAAYAVRIVVLRQEGIDAAGLYQAAWAIGGLYPALILRSMLADYYPRLTAVHKNNVECNRLINEQLQISILLAAPGVIATLAASPLVMHWFYSAEFGPAVTLLRWICLGMMLRIVAWPIGFILLAKGVQRIYVATEIAATIVHVGFAWLLVRAIGLDGSGAAFFGLYAWHTILIYLVARHLSGFRFSAENRKYLMILLPATVLVFCGYLVLPFWPAMAIGVVAVCMSSLYSFRTLLLLLPPDSMPRLMLSGILRWATRR